MFVIDTNIISNAVKSPPSACLFDCMAAQLDEDLLVVSLTIAEIRRGIPKLPSGKKTDGLDAWFTGEQGPQAFLPGKYCRSTTEPA